MPDITVQDFIRQEAQRAKVPPELALAVAEQESSFNPGAIGQPVGKDGQRAVGVFQILPSTAQTEGLGDITDPQQNVRGGVEYLRRLLAKHEGSGDLSKVLAEYGGVRTNTTYVPEVLARLGKYTSQTTPPPSTPSTSTTSTVPTAPPPRPTMDQRLGKPGGPPPRPGALYEAERATKSDLPNRILQGFDPRTSQGRENLAGGVGAIAATALVPEVAVPAWLARTGLAARVLKSAAAITGAYAGGAGESLGEHAIATTPPPDPRLATERARGLLSAAHTAGTEQAGYEAGGQAVGWLWKGLARRVGASSVAKSVSANLDAALEGIKARTAMNRTATSPREAGHLVEAVAQGPAKSVKDQVGRDVLAAAQSGPPLDITPVKAKLSQMAEETIPKGTAAPEITEALKTGSVVPSGATSEERVAQRQAFLQQAEQALPAQHPLPKVLQEIDQLPDQISFADAHIYKRRLDEAVNWDRTAKKQAEQLAKGARGALRAVMTDAAHTPYEEATAAYGPIAKLYEKGEYPKLHRNILANPSSLVNGIKWRNPDSAKLVRDLTIGVTEQGDAAGAQQGEAAWNAVRAAWTQEKLLAGGPAKLSQTMQQMEASNAGVEFIQTMYGDPAGQTVWTNLKQLGTAWEEAAARVKEFPKSDLVAHANQSVRRDLAYTVLPGHPITKVGAITRLVSGPNVTEMLQWASYAPARTRFVVNHVLSGPNPGMALADFMRWFTETGGEPDQPVPSHAPTAPPPTTPPPAPTSARR